MYYSVDENILIRVYLITLLIMPLSIVNCPPSTLIQSYF